MFLDSEPVSRWLPRWRSGKESACQCRRGRFGSWVRKIPWRRKWQPISVFLPGKSHGLRSLAVLTVLGVAKSKLRLSSHSTEVSVSNLKPLGETWDFSDSP